MTDKITESVVEEAALAWLKALGYSIAHDPDIAPSELRVKYSGNFAETVA